MRLSQKPCLCALRAASLVRSNNIDHSKLLRRRVVRIGELCLYNFSQRWLALIKARCLAAQLLINFPLMGSVA